MLTKKYFEMIADGIENARRDIYDKEPDDCMDTLLDGVSYAAEHLADKLAMDNPKFDRARFLRACGVEQ